MLALQPVTGLTLDTIQLLKKYKITTILDLLECDEWKFKQITKLPSSSLLIIKNELQKRYGPTRILLTEKLVNKTTKNCSIEYGSGIKGLDNLCTLAAGSVWEICGTAGIGKTQLCFTLSVNFVDSYKAMALYIDTKCDFSGCRIRDMLKSRNLNNMQCGHIMQQIRVKRVFYTDEIIETLEQLLTCNTAEANSIKLVVIDSMPIVHFLPKSTFLNDNYLLATIANLVHKIAEQRQVVFLLVRNTFSAKSEYLGTKCCKESDEEDSKNEYEQQLTQFVETRSDVGQYWNSVPNVRLSVELAQTTTKDSSMRVLKVLKSNYTQKGASVNVHIQNVGVI